MNSVEDRVHAAMSAAGDLADREIRTAPPLRLPSAPAADRRHAPRRWIRWVAPLTAAAVVVALAISLALVKDVQNGSMVPPAPTTSAGPGGIPRYYVAAAGAHDIVVGDSVAGQTLAKLALPAPRNFTSLFMGITAADDDRTFVVLTLTYLSASISGRDGFKNATGTASWYEVKLAPGTATPARLIDLPVKPQTVHGYSMMYLATALSGSGKELAVTRTAASGGLAVQVFSVTTGQLLHEWTTNDPSLSELNKDHPQGLSAQPALTWIDEDRVLAVETSSRAAKPGGLITGYSDVVRELNVSGPADGDLVADGKVVWNVRTEANRQAQSLLQACATGINAVGAVHVHLISADGTSFGCLAVTGPGTNPNLSFLTYPLATGTAVAGKASIDYRVTNMAKKAVSTDQVLWISPSGDAIVGAWTIYAKGTLEDAPNGLYVGVLSHGKFTPLRFPPGFDREAHVGSITW